MIDIIVFAVGLLVCMLVVFGIFSRVPLEMHDAGELKVSKASAVKK